MTDQKHEPSEQITNDHGPMEGWCTHDEAPGSCAVDRCGNHKPSEQESER